LEEPARLRRHLILGPKLVGVGRREESGVRHRVPQEIGEPRRHLVGREGQNARLRLGWIAELDAIQEVGALQDGLDHRLNPVRERGAHAVRLVEREKRGLLGGGQGTAIRLLSEGQDERLRARVGAGGKGAWNELRRWIAQGSRRELFGRRLIRLRQERRDGEGHRGVREVANLLIGWKLVRGVGRIAEEITNGVVVLGLGQAPERCGTRRRSRALCR
jgi:hypothetical protein